MLEPFKTAESKKREKKSTDALSYVAHNTDECFFFYY